MMRSKVPLIYSSAHKDHAPEFEFVEGKLVPYYETPLRVERMLEHLLGLEYIDPVESYDAISKEEILLIHRSELVEYVENVSVKLEHAHEYVYPYVFATRPSMGNIKISSLQDRFGYYCFDTCAPIGKGTWQAAMSSATVAAIGASMLLRGDTSVAYALCRPPGHHAGSDFFGGYCYFNNAALAASKLLNNGKAAIIDLDYHHGNGTQEIFWEERDVFFGSIHANPFDEYPYYSGYAEERGGQHALGTNFNIPLPSGTSSEDYLTALEMLTKAVGTFRPMSLVVSIGYDTYYNDPLGGFGLTLSTYREIGAKLAQLRLPTLFVQEGGYNIDAQGSLGEELIRGFLEEAHRVII